MSDPKRPEGPGPFVLARCVYSKTHKRWIAPGEVPAGEMPMCQEELCGGVMVAVKAVSGR